MEKIILDTDIFIDYFRGVAEAELYFKNLPANQRYTTDVTLMELFSGARDKRQLATIVRFIEENGFHIFPITTLQHHYNCTQLCQIFILKKCP